MLLASLEQVSWMVTRSEPAKNVQGLAGGCFLFPKQFTGGVLGSCRIGGFVWTGSFHSVSP